MFGRISRAALIWPSLLSLLGLAILISLGTWQLNRKAEKEALIAAIKTRQQGLPRDLEGVLRSSSVEDADYRRVSVKGRFLADKVRFYYAPQPRLGPGYDVYQPLVYAPGKAVWIDRGFIPERVRQSPEVWRAPEGEVMVTGNLRRPAKPGAFTPENDLLENIWYWRDLDGMHRSAFGVGSDVKPAPLFLVAEAEKRRSGVDGSRGDGGSWPRPGVSEIVIFNRHLEYALTWYGLAATLLAVYFAYAWTRLRHIR
jgi:surfeit locus 1 family protein